MNSSSSQRNQLIESFLLVILAFSVVSPISSCRAQSSGETEPPSENAVEEKNQPEKHKANRLANESSPYLLLHAHNPVDWYPWGPEAFERAKKENKPIFLSIGYSSCFWCHVMERKVFENEKIAAYMNEHFVNVKVDREERPDVDEIYMLSLQVYMQMIGSGQGGGWPLSMFLTPDGKPIAGGTYFPPEDMPGRPGFPTVMGQLLNAWRTRSDDVVRTAEMVSREVQRLSQPSLQLGNITLNQNSVESAVNAVADSFDPEYGGFDFSPQAPNRPKFPTPSKLMLLQSEIATDPENSENLSKMIDHTLETMAAGGIYDHLGGGFHRYSTERKWLVPHFEKMLYDNAQLVEVYTQAFRRTRNPKYRTVVEETLDFVLRELTDQNGAFYSALDAETDGVEGEFYVWSADEIKQTLGAADYQIFSKAYGLEKDQTFEHGLILHRPQSIASLGRELSIPQKELSARLLKMRKELLAVRMQRKPLLRDDKILTSWNGLMIRAFAIAGKTFDRPEYIAAAEKAATYLLTNLRDNEGRLLRTSRNGKASLNAYLDDYAFLTSGLLALYDASRSEKWLNTARRLTDNQIALFWDRENHGFYFTTHDHESLIARTKSAYDSEIPSGNSVAVSNLLRLSQLAAAPAFITYAQQTLEVFGPQFERSPSGMTYYAMGLKNYLKLAGPITSAIPQNLSSETTPSPKSTPSSNSRETKVGLAVAPSEANKHPRLKAVGFFDVDTVKPNSTCRVAIHLKIADGWHINANPAQPDFVIPTQLKIAEPQGLTLKDVKYPEGDTITLPGIETPLSVYEGEVVIHGTFAIPANMTADTSVELHLRYQACDDETCERPETIILRGTLRVGDSAGSPINQDYFVE